MYSQEYQEIVKLFHDRMSFTETKRVPHLSGFYTWKIHDSEFSFKEALYDDKKMEKLVCDFHHRYNFDGYFDLGTRNPMRLVDSMGPGSIYIFNEYNDSFNVVDKVMMDETGYDAFADDPIKAVRAMIKTKYPNATAKNLLNGMNELINFGRFSGKMAQTFAEKFSRPSVFSMTGAIMMPAEFFSSTTRGIKNYALDMRRCPEAVTRAQDTYFKHYNKPAIEKNLASDTSVYITDCYTALLAYATMNVKQFEKFYWPYLKEYIDTTIDHNKRMYIYTESTMLRFTDFFNDYPKGYIVIHPEEDSVFTLKEKMPNICISGGMSTITLGTGSPEQAVEEAKTLIDGMGPGFILSQDKMVSFKNDCKRENLLAVCNFVREYEI